MQHLRFLGAALALAVLTAPLAPGWAEAPAAPALTNPVDIVRSVPNFNVVCPALLRGGQPNDDGFRQLKRAGVKTVVNLRNEEVLVDRERSLVRKLGMRYLNIPMDAFSQPNREDFERFVAVVRDPSHQPVFVHCFHGEDRTGSMVAAYRIAVDGWSAGKAYDEMLSFGFKPVLTNLTRAVFAFAGDKGKPEPMPSPAVIISDIKKRLSRASARSRS